MRVTKYLSPNETVRIFYVDGFLKNIVILDDRVEYEGLMSLNEIKYEEIELNTKIWTRCKRSGE